MEEDTVEVRRGLWPRAVLWEMGMLLGAGKGSKKVRRGASRSD